MRIRKHQAEEPQDGRGLLSDCGSYAPAFLNDVHNKGSQARKEQARVPFHNTKRPENSAIATLLLSDAYNIGTRARKKQARVPLYGRSMVEMLGVLAIIGVLSVGAIAGYSTAMDKYRTNEMINGYNHLIMNILKYREDYSKLSYGSRISPYLKKQNAIPHGFKYIDTNNLEDLWKNRVDLWSSGDRETIPGARNIVAVDVYFANTEKDANTQACNVLLQELFVPLRDRVEFVGLWRGYNASGSAGSGFQNIYYGSKCPKGSQCLKDLTVTKINESCSQVCEKGRNCSILAAF